MNTKQFFKTLFFLFMALNVHAQKEIVFAEKMVGVLNKKVAPTFQFNLAKDTGTVNILNTKQNISLENPLKKSKLFESQTDKTKKGPYIGPIYWVYDMDKAISTSANFQLDSMGLLKLHIAFDFPETIVINSKKNAFSDVHRTSDVMPHKVLWEGQKSLVVHLTFKQESNEIIFEVNKVELKGVLKRTDQFELSKFYVKDFATVFKRELSKVFENQALKSQINRKLIVEEQ